MRVAPDPTPAWARHVCDAAQVPVWLPWPLPQGWVVTSVTPVGDEVSGVRATALTLGGPSPLGGFAELMLVAEQPGVGLGARVCGLLGAEPTADVAQPPYSRVMANGHIVPLWLEPTDRDCAVVVGEWDLTWLWLVVRPAAAGVLLVDPAALTDAREIGDEVLVLPYGARSTWLDPP
jgi:hypothetical protein